LLRQPEFIESPQISPRTRRAEAYEFWYENQKIKINKNLNKKIK